MSTRSVSRWLAGLALLPPLVPLGACNLIADLQQFDGIPSVTEASAAGDGDEGPDGLESRSDAAGISRDMDAASDAPMFETGPRDALADVVDARSLVVPDPTIQPRSCGGTACADPAMIADFERNDGAVCASQGRSGYTVMFNDGTGVQWPAAGANLSQFSPLATCRGTSAVAFHTRGDAFTSWGAGFGVHFGAPVYDASPYSGLTFWAMSSTSASIRIKVATTETQDHSLGGTCVSGGGLQCGDHFSTRRTLSPVWSLYTVTFVEMRQEGWGVPAGTPTMDTRSLQELDVIFDMNTFFDVWLDDISFTK